MADSAIAPGRYRLWIQGLCWLLLGPLFFLSYGQVNHFTATRADFGSLVFSWEHAIPFIPWTIAPYWSIDLLYGLSLLICTSQRELTRHAWRLLRQSQDTLRVCCALGLSRSATVVAAWLLTEKHADSVEAAVAMIRSQRPQVVLTPDHLRLLEQFKEAQFPTSV